MIGRISRIRERANLYVERKLREVEIEGILPAHGSILNFLFQQDTPVSMKEIVKKVGRVKSTVTGMIHTLEHHGYVEKLQSLEDGRVQLVRLTEKGRGLRPHFDAISEELIAQFYGAMPQADRVQLAALLGQVEFNFGT